MTMSILSSSSVALPPTSNSELVANVDAKFLDSSECDDIVARLRPDTWVPASVTTEDRRYGTVDPRHRSVLTQPVPLQSEHPICRKLLAAVGEANSRFWRFDLLGFPTFDAPSVLLYDSEVADHFAPHVDAGAWNSTRKLSFSVQLSEPDSYRGGDLVFPLEGTTASRERGSITLFSSLTLHEVLPVIAGQRLALVGWMHGPAFR